MLPSSSIAGGRVNDADRLEASAPVVFGVVAVKLGVVVDSSTDEVFADVGDTSSVSVKEINSGLVIRPILAVVVRVVFVGIVCVECSVDGAIRACGATYEINLVLNIKTGVNIVVQG